MKFVPLCVEKHWSWVATHAKCKQCIDTRGIVCEDDSGGILAAAILDSWSYNSCQLHIAILNPFVIRRGFLNELCRFVFVVSERGVMIGITPADNEKALKFNTHAGMQEVGRIRDGFKPGVDYVITEMRRESSPWLTEEERNGWEIVSRAS
jgi:hypothetical protein